MGRTPATIQSRLRPPLVSLPDRAQGIGIAGGATGYVLTQYWQDGTPKFTPNGTPLPGPISATLNWNDLVWIDPPTANSTIGTGFITSFSNVGHVIAADAGALFDPTPINGSVSLGNIGSMPYDGPMVNCNAHIEVLVSNGILNSNTIVIRDSLFNFYLNEQLSTLGVGSFDFPFVIPALVAETLTVSWSNNMPLANNARELSYTISLTPFA